MLLSSVSAANARGRVISKYFEFDGLNEDRFETSGILPDDKAQSIDIKDVSFAYAHTGKEILKNINLTIPAGKKIALVGENGSGKTTLVKLICGLLVPGSGKITTGTFVITGCCDKLMSAVFQDFKLFAFSIEENIKMSETDKSDIQDILERAGLSDDIDKLTRGICTPIYKSFDDSGIELSMGQGQKLAIARAIYKNTGIIILDEPTASLDPKTEAEMFNNFQTITAEKTAVLVSHRLSSCRFCDLIVVLDDGRIIQQGTHEELMRVKGGKYEEMFTAQAEYYK